MKKRFQLLRRMNAIDKAALAALCVAVGVGVGITAYQNSRPLPAGGRMTVLFTGVQEGFGEDIVLGEVVTDHNQTPIGTIANVSRESDGTLLLTVATTPDYPGAVGQTVFLRSKHFAGTGQIKTYTTGDASYATR